MAIIAIARDFNNVPNIVRVVAENTLAEVAAADYVLNQADELAALNAGEWTWLVGDLILVQASDGDQFFQFDGDDFTTFIQLPGGNGEVTLPVVAGNFAVFDGTLGALEDGGFVPSDATKTSVVMAGSATQVNYIAHFIDTAGTVDDTAANIQNDGNIQAGKSGVAGTLISFPTTAANGSLIISALNAGGAFNTTLRNSVMGQSSVISFPDPGVAATKVLLTDSATTQTVATGNITMTAGLLIESAVNGLTALAGGAQAGTALTRQINRVTTVATAADSVQLPAATAGKVVTAINAAAANAMAVFPQTGESINALAANTAISVAANKTITFYCAVAGIWNSILTA